MAEPAPLLIPDEHVRHQRRITRVAAIGFLLFAVIFRIVAHPFYMPSGSMEHTLEINDRIFANLVYYSLHQPQLGDIVVFTAPRNADPEQKMFVKRVVGLPGDRIKIENGYLWRNGEKIEEPCYQLDPATGEWIGAPGPDGYCIADRIAYKFPDPDLATSPVSPQGDYLYRSRTYDFQIKHGEYVVPSGTVFVLGDNRNMSNDSHVFGPLPMASLRGKVYYIFYPPQRVRLLK